MAAALFDPHWERPAGVMQRRTAATEGDDLERIAVHLGACRRAGLYLYGAGVISRREHAAIVRTLERYERRLVRRYAAGARGRGR